MVAGWNQNFLRPTSGIKAPETLALRLGAGGSALPGAAFGTYLKQLLHQTQGLTPALDSADMKHLLVIPLSTWSLQKPSAQRENVLEEPLIIQCCTVTVPAQGSSRTHLAPMPALNSN